MRPVRSLIGVLVASEPFATEYFHNHFPALKAATDSLPPDRPAQSPALAPPGDSTNLQASRLGSKHLPILQFGKHRSRASSVQIFNRKDNVMKGKLNFLVIGIFLVAVSSGFGQSSSNYTHVVENAGLATLIVPHTGDTNTEVSADLAARDLNTTNSPSGHQLDKPNVTMPDSQFQGLAGNEISYRLSPQVGMKAEDKPAVTYLTALEIQAATPINVVPSEKFPGVVYSGILVQAARSNPLQLLNPFAPAVYGDGEENVVRDLVTGEIEGLKILRIAF